MSCRTATCSTSVSTSEGSVLADGPGRSHCVELIRVIEDGRLGGADSLSVVVRRNCMQELGCNRALETCRSRFDQAQAKMDMPEEASLCGLAEGRAVPELDGAPDVVEERGCKKEIAAKTRMELRSLAAQGGDTHRVLEQPAGVAVVPVGTRGRECPIGGPQPVVGKDSGDDVGKPGMGDLTGEKLEEAVELVCVASHRGRQVGGVGVRCRLDGAHLNLEPSTELLHAPEHADSIAFCEAAIEELHVVPNPRLDPSGRIDELEGKVRRAVLRPTPFLTSDGVDALDCAILGELGDAGHVSSLGLLGGTLGPWLMWHRSGRFGMRTRQQR